MITKETEGVISAAVKLAMKELETVERKAIPGWYKGDKTMEYKGDTGGFKSFTEFLKIMKDSPEDARLKQLSEGTDSEGGYLCPEGFSNKIQEMAYENSAIRPHGATSLTMSRDSLNVPTIVDESHETGSGVSGGIVCYWQEEGGSATVVEPTFGNVKLIAKKLVGYTYASNELLTDSAVPLDTILGRLFSRALNWYEDLAFIEGTGVGQPLGILNSGAFITPYRATASAIEGLDIATMWSRLYPASFNGSVWLASPTVLPDLAALATTNLTWLKADQGMAKEMPMSLFGRPIYLSEKLPALGTAGDILLADLSYYLIGDRQKFRIAVSPHYRFMTDQTCFRFTIRVDGQPWVDSAFTPKYGDTLSPFVGLHAATGA